MPSDQVSKLPRLPILQLSLLVYTDGTLTMIIDTISNGTSGYRRRAKWLMVSIVLCGVLLLVACAASGNAERPLYLALVWHQHQPLYTQDAQGIYTRPWVRVHATKDYWDMAAIIEQYPDITMTINLTPILLEQLTDLAAGATDSYQKLAETAVDRLSADERRFIVERFFDANHTNIIARFPRYKELLDKRSSLADLPAEERAARFGDQDIRDLQLLFQLAWFDPDFLVQPPLAALVAKQRGYDSADIAIVLAEARRIVADVIPLHRRLQESGAIEVTTTPYAHPILPLIFDSDITKQNDPDGERPYRFTWAGDADAHIARAIALYRRHFGRNPSGLWPGEGAVSQQIVPLVAEAGFRWMASGEKVLAGSLNLGDIVRDEADIPIEAERLYRPYRLRTQPGRQRADGQGEQGEQQGSAPARDLYIIFRDQRLSDLIGFEYSGMPARDAVDDLIGRLEALRARLPGDEPHLVSIILDGENAWEHYPNDGKEFLHELYARLSAHPDIRTVTPTQFIDEYPDQPYIENLWPGAWFSRDYATWIGEPDENEAWDLLRSTRVDLEVALRSGSVAARDAETATTAMLRAEGSDWFWWYGSDQDSGNDDYFDTAFRGQLQAVYRALQQTPPARIAQPIRPPRRDIGQLVGALEQATILHSVADPVADDYGAGTLQYPLEPIFEPGVFDLTAVEMRATDDRLIFSITLQGNLTNPWNSPVGLALQTIDIYIDSVAGAGSRRLLEGRGARLPEGRGWDVAITAEGWIRGIFRPQNPSDPDSPAVEISSTVDILTDPARRTIHIIVPRSIVATSAGAADPTQFAVAYAVMSQDGFPSAGVRRIRDVAPQPTQWKLGNGGQPAGDLRIIDIAWPADGLGSQARYLGEAIVPMVQSQ